MAGYSKQYRENRLRVLAGNPMCYHCHKRKATTADHLIEKDRGGTDSLDNLVPSCAKCNYARGARYGNAKRAAEGSRKRAARQEALRGKPTPQRPSEAFLGQEDMTPSAPWEKSPQKRPRTAKNAPKGAESQQSTSRSHDLPRLESAILGSGSHGPDAVEFARDVLGITLMPWQERVLYGLLAWGDDGRSPRMGYVSVARQNGKSVALKVLLAYWLVKMPIFRGSKQTVITTAHQLDLAVAMFQDLAPLLEEKFGAKAKWSYGRNELTMPDGSMWLVRAATANAGHGRSPDLVCCDETWGISEDTIDQGLLPSQRARPNPLFVSWSTAGTDASKWMLRWREQGIRSIGQPAGSMYFAEWSPPPGCDLTNPDNWGYANPALGHTLEVQTLIDESKAPNRGAFLRASLNLWVSSDSSWLEPGTWDALKTTLPQPVTTVLAFDSSQDDSRYCGVIAGLLPDGRCVLSTAFQTNTEVEAWAEVRRLLPAGATLAVTPSLEIHTPPELRRSMVIVGYAELTKWTALVRSMIIEGRICHRGDPALADHMGRAVAAKTQNGVALSSQKSPGPIELARCAVWAAALATKAKWSARPQMGVSRRG